MPIFVLRERSTAFVLFICNCKSRNTPRCHVERSETSPIYFRSAHRHKNPSEILRFAQNDSLISVDRHVLIVLLQRLAVFGDGDGFTIKNPNRDALAAKLNRTIGRGNPSFERGFSVIAHRYSDISSLERPYGHSILFGRFRWR